jgi:hypothetical protein
MGLSPISIIGFGFRCVSSEMRVPKPPAKMTTFKQHPLVVFLWPAKWLQYHWLLNSTYIDIANKQPLSESVYPPSRAIVILISLPPVTGCRNRRRSVQIRPTLNPLSTLWNQTNQYAAILEYGEGDN